MKKTNLFRKLLLGGVILSSSMANAQTWLGSGAAGNTGPIYRSGNVGIGTFSADPTSNLHLKGQNVALRVEGESAPNPSGPIADNYSTINVVGNNPTLNLTGVGNIAGAYYPKISFQNLFELKYSVYPACGSGNFKIGNVTGGNAMYINPDGTFSFGSGPNTGCYGSWRMPATFAFLGSVGAPSLWLSPLNVGGNIASGYLLGVNGKSHFNNFVSIGVINDISANGYVLGVSGNSSLNGSVGIGGVADPTSKLLVTGDARVSGNIGIGT
ncbi:MAG: hypothetical protein K2Q22_03820, partial [Cytophagales bacterium]|nr:hypothetical protein [Cytophagales bacterium]